MKTHLQFHSYPINYSRYTADLDGVEIRGPTEPRQSGNVVGLVVPVPIDIVVEISTQVGISVFAQWLWGRLGQRPTQVKFVRRTVEVTDEKIIIDELTLEWQGSR